MNERDYAFAIGTFVLAINKMEEEIFQLIEALFPGDLLNIDKAYLGEKITKLKALAHDYPDRAIGKQILDLVEKAEQFNKDRRGIVHGVLWTDMFDGTHYRRFVPRKSSEEEQHDDRTPKQLREVAYEVEKLADTAALLASIVRRSRVST